MASQGLLFSEPSIAETGVWCELSPSIDPSEWASLCRYIGKLSPSEFRRVRGVVVGRQESPVEVPLFSIGPSGIGGRYQREG